jgi:hypothetical protein
MERPLREKWIFAGLILAVLLLVCTGTGWGQRPGASPEGTAEEEAAPPPAPKPEEEKLPPGAPEKPGAFPTFAAPEFTTHLEAGPATGITAPYGNPVAMDTLARGWTVHPLAALRISPYLAYTGMYRSNIYDTPTNKKTDFINFVTPGVQIEMPLAGQHRLSVAYLGEYYIASKYDPNSHYDHNINIDTVLNFPGGLGFRFGNTYRAATEEQTAVTGHQRPYERYDPYMIADYKFSDRWKLQGIYQFDALDFVHSVDRADNYQEHVGGVNLYYRFWPKTAAFLEYLITSRQYPFSPQANNTAHSAFIGLTWDPTAKLTGSVKFGGTFKNYDEDVPGRKKSLTDSALSIQLLYRYSRYTQVTLTAQRSIQEDVDFGNNAYVNSGVYAAIYHEWPYWQVTTYVAGSYTNNSYENPAPNPGTTKTVMRNDNLVTFGAGIVRPFTRWMRLRLDYNYTNRGTNANTLGYNEHRVLIGAQTSF